MDERFLRNEMLWGKDDGDSKTRIVEHLKVVLSVPYWLISILTDSTNTSRNMLKNSIKVKEDE